MIKFSKIKTIISIIICVIFGIASCILNQYNVSGNMLDLSINELAIRLSLYFCVATCVGAFLCIFINMQIFFVTYIPALMLIFGKTVASNLNSASLDSKNVVVFLIFTIIFIYFTIQEYVLNNKALKIDRLSEYKSKEARRELSKKQVYVSKGKNGEMYQVIKGKNRYYFRCIGSFLLGTKDELYITNFDNIDEKIVEENDFVIEKCEISKIKASIWPMRRNANCGNLIFELSNLCVKKFFFIDVYESKNLSEFFDNDVEIKDCMYDNKDIEEISNDEKRKPIIKNLNLLLFNICILASIILPFAFLFNSTYLGNILFFIAFILTLSPYIIYIFFKKYITLREAHQYEYINYSYLYMPIRFSCLTVLYFVYILLNIGNFIFTDFTIFAVISIIVIIILSIAILLKDTRRKYFACLIIFCLLIFVPSSVVKFNSAIPHNIEKLNCEVINKTIKQNDKDESKDIYQIHYVYNGNEHINQIKKENYDNINIGDYVIIEQHNGALGIEYLVLILEEE